MVYPCNKQTHKQALQIGAIDTLPAVEQVIQMVRPGLEHVARRVQLGRAGWINHRRSCGERVHRIVVPKKRKPLVARTKLYNALLHAKNST